MQGKNFKLCNLKNQSVHSVGCMWNVQKMRVENVGKSQITESCMPCLDKEFRYNETYLFF